MAKVGLYAGSFDPIHYGHLAVISDALSLFDKVVVAVTFNTAKQDRLFSLHERIQAIEESVASVIGKNANVEVIQNTSLLTAELAYRRGITHLIRGIRNSADVESELSQAITNREIVSKLSIIDRNFQSLLTVIIPTRAPFTHISSTAVRTFVQYKQLDLINDYVPPVVRFLIEKKHADQR
jgi:pantetheine-phosphate adenylyltransferase